MRFIRCLLLGAWLGSWSAPAALADPDCLVNYPVGVFVAHSFTDAQGATRQGTNHPPIYSQLSGRLRSSGASVVEIAAGSGNQALARTRDQARLLAFFELIARARPIALPGGQRTNWQDVQLEASLRIIDAAARRQLGSATDVVTVAGLSIEDALPTAVPGLMDRLTTAAISQACASSDLLPPEPPDETKVERVAQHPKPDLEAEREALSVILEFAGEICQDIPLDASSSTLDLSGEGTAKLNGLIDKIADIGIAGSAQYKREDYQNVLREDLAATLAKSTDCKLEIWRDLKDRFLPGGG